MEKRSVAITGKVDFDTFEKLNKYLELNPENNKSGIIGISVKRFLSNPDNTSGDPNPKILNENKQLKTKINVLVQNNETLKAEVQALNDMLESREPCDTAELKTLKTENETLKTENETLSKQLEKPKLSGNQLLINLPPTLKPFLIEVANRETNRTGRKVTKDMILLNLFWAQVSRGPGDHLPLTFSSSEIRKRLEIVKQQQKPTAK